MALHEKVLPPSLHFRDPNPNIDWAHSPFKVNTELREWPAAASGARSAAVSAFGFGGTNFPAVLEEYVPGRHRGDERRSLRRRGRPPDEQRGDRRRQPPAGSPAPTAATAPRRRPCAAPSSSAPPPTPHSPPGCATPSRPRPPSRRSPRRRRQPPTWRRPCASRSTTATRPSWPTRPPGRSRPWSPASRRCGRCCDPWRVPRPWARTEDRLPVHGAGLAVPQHAQDAALGGAHRGRHVRRGRPDHDAAARAAAQ